MTEQEVSFNYEMAEMALRGKRFKEAEEKYKEIAAKTNSTEAWCGIGISKYGQLLDNVPVDEIFYCFQKAKSIDESKISEIETIAIETSMEVIKSLYDLIILTGKAMDQAHLRMVQAALATVIGTMSTFRSDRRGSVMGTIVSAGFTAISFNEYVNASTSLQQMHTLNETAFAVVDKIKSNLQKLVTKELVLAEKFHAILNKTHEEVTVTIPTLKQVEAIRGEASMWAGGGRLVIKLGPIIWILGLLVFCIDPNYHLGFETISMLALGIMMIFFFRKLCSNEEKRINAQADELERSVKKESIQTLK